MNFDILRQKILEKAIRGELVPQLESEPEVKQIGEAPEDVPFAIPEKWKWSQLLGIFDVYQPKTISTKELNADGNYFVYGANGIIGKYTNYNHENSEVVIACRGATCGAVNITKPKSWINGNAMVVRPINNLVCHEYLVAFLKVFNWDQVTSGSAQPQITRKNLSSVLFPVPPIKEQHRIVTKLNQLFEQIDRAEKAYNELSGPLSDRFRQLCLEKAIQGKLVPQLESEPVVNQIGDVPDNCPFRLPKKWKWVKLGAAFSLKAGKFISASEIKDSGAYPCYGGNGKRGYVDKFNREGRFPLIGRQGALCGNINLVDGKFYATEHAVVADGGNIIDPDCAAFFLKALNLNQYATKTAQPGLSVKRISKTPFPLAPIQEQKRIVKKIQDLLLEISSIKQS